VACQVSDFQIHEALVFPDQSERIVQTVLAPFEGGAEAAIYSRSASEHRWYLHATAELQTSVEHAVVNEPADIEAIRARCDVTIEAAAYYDELALLGLEFGASFRGLREIYRRDREALGMMQLPNDLRREAGSYGIHPALLDACFHLLGAALPAELRGRTYLMVAIDHFQLLEEIETVLWNHATLHENPEANGETFSADVRLYDEEGRLVAEALGLQLKLATSEALARIVRNQSGGLLYEVTWQPAPAIERSSGSTLDAVEVAKRSRSLLEQLIAHHGLNVYSELLPELDRLCAGYVATALSQLGLKFDIGELLDAGALAAQLGIMPRYRRLFERLLEILCVEGVLRPDGAGWRIAAAPDVQADLEAVISDLAARFPVASGEITLTARCGAALADVLRGDADPLELLFPDGSLTELVQLYDDAPFARAFNDLVSEAVKQVVAGLPTGRPVRVLEIGAGTGMTTRAALSALPAERLEYWFTDISPLFLERARERFSSVERLRFELFDLERVPASQGIPGGRFNVVIAANVVHATEDLRRTLKHIRELLAPGGALLLVEGAEPHPWVDLTFGLTDGWWKFSDTDLRPSYPLIDQRAWTQLLNEMGFKQPQVVECGRESSVDQMLIIAGAPQPEKAGIHDWLVIPDSTGVSDGLVSRLEGRGDHVKVVKRANEVAAWVDRRAETGAMVRVLHLAALDAPPVDAPVDSQIAFATEVCDSVVDVVREVGGRAEATEFWIVTQGAQPAAVPSSAPLQATLWGLGRVIALEHPEIWGGLIDLDPADDADIAASRLVAEIDITDNEDQIAMRGAQRLVPRLVQAELPAIRPLNLRGDSSYLVIGGTGGIGLKIARWLAESGARHIVLTGRKALPPREEWHLGTAARQATQIEAIKAIEAMGASAEIVAANAGDREQMAALFSRFEHDLPPLRGIVHAAAHLGAYPLSQLPPDEIAAMLRPKVAGTLLLHELSRGFDLDFFTLFSSTTALWGSSRMAHYAAANTFLDAFAHWRGSMGLPGLSINWGTWDEMRVATADERRVVADFGLNPLPSEVALATLRDLLGSSTAQIAVAAVDWQRLKPAYEARRERPFLALVGGGPEQRSTSAGAGPEKRPPDLLTLLQAARPDDWRDVTANWVQREVALTLGRPAGQQIDPQQGLFQVGLDSLMAVDLKGRLEAGLAKNLPATLIFNHPTVHALTGFLLAEIEASASQSTTTNLETNGASDRPLVDHDTSDLDELSEDELELLLAQRLARM
jgi:SAM-dependent methyltransferase/NADP-dependent 3-hydroxy acid dehydrogenase YdfG